MYVWFFLCPFDVATNRRKGRLSALHGTGSDPASAVRKTGGRLVGGCSASRSPNRNSTLRRIRRASSRSDMQRSSPGNKKKKWEPLEFHPRRLTAQLSAEQLPRVIIPWPPVSLVVEGSEKSKIIPYIYLWHCACFRRWSQPTGTT